MNDEQRGFLNTQLMNCHFVSTAKVVRALLASERKAEIIAEKFLFAIISVEDDKEFAQEAEHVLTGFLERGDKQLIAFYDTRYMPFSHFSSIKRVLRDFPAELAGVKEIAVAYITAHIEEQLQDHPNVPFLFRVYAENRDEMRKILNDVEDAAWELRKKEEENG